MEMCLGVNSDAISSLPDNVIDQILICIPIKEAVRTSVLSSKWRYKWTTIPELVFHDHDARYTQTNKDKFIKFVDRVFLLHSGLINKCHLTFWHSPATSAIDCWILFLSRKNIKEFVFKTGFLGEGRYKLPACLFSFQQVSTLELHCCVIKPPPTFTGYSNLKSLYLNEITLDHDGFEFLISKCPVLERLAWKLFDNVGHLHICCPNLKYLHLSGTFVDICFENTPFLSEVFISLTAYMSEIIEKCHPIETSNLYKILSALPSLRKFEVNDYFMQFLGVGKIPEKLPVICHHLIDLSLAVNLDYVNGICVILCLLNSSPNLRELKIMDSSSKPGPDVDAGNIWVERNDIDWNMSNLQFVKIRFDRGYELEFTKLLLANSSMLELLSIRSSQLKDRSRLKFLKELLILPRASPNAKIKFIDWDEEEDD